MAAPITLPTGDRTLINSVSQITFVNSPIHLRLQNVLKDTSIQSIAVYLWIWNGAQASYLAKPNFTLIKKKVSLYDNYINVEIADLIKSFLENPINAPNTYQPSYAYNELTAPAMTGQGVFWQIVTDITSSAGTVRNNYSTNYATLGYKWNYEQNARLGSNGISPGGSTGFLKTVKKWYNPQINNYITQTFNLTNSVALATSANMITQTPVTPPAALSRCSRDPSLVVFLNKAGLWDTFTPNGKFTASSSITSEVTSKAFRDPQQIDNSYQHSKERGPLYVGQSYVINTGSLTEDMVDHFEELLYSPKVYLIRFKGDVVAEAVLGITVDDTFITVDDTTITVDSVTVTAEALGLLKSFQQIPVIITDSDFTRKSRINDKNEIDYNFKLEETNNKINNIR